MARPRTSTSQWTVWFKYTSDDNNILLNSRDYNEAMKCFKQAVRLDSDNLVLARDLTTLQIHEGNVVRIILLIHS